MSKLKNKKSIWKNLAILLVAFALILIIIGKLLINPSPVLFFMFYGLCATLAVVMMFVVANFKYKDLSIEIISQNLNAGKKKPFISIVFAVFNEEDIIEDCLRSVIGSTYRNREIIVVNDASTDNTLHILKKFEKFPGVRILDLKKNLGKKKAIAKGLEIARGEIFVFTDSDSIIAENAIGRIIEIFMHDPEVGAVSGHARALNADQNLITKIQDSWYEGQFAVKKAFESAFNNVTCISGPLAVFRRAAIFNYITAWERDSFLGKEFKFATDRTLTAYVLGGKEIGDKLKQKYSDSFFVKSEKYPSKDWKSLYCKSAKVWTNVPDTFIKFAKQNIRWKKSFLRNIFLTGTFYWRKPLPVAFRYYLNILFVIVGPIIVLRHVIFFPLRGEYVSGMLYLAGILFVGFVYGLAIRIDDSEEKNWVYRPLMSFISTFLMSWLVFYAIITIKNNIWHRS